MGSFGLSIIIPVYNAAQYLDRCLLSVVDQGLTSDSYEIILVNDGSVDNSLGICNRYKDRFPNITVIDKKNEGPAVARNRGLDVAKGEFVTFVDADDYLIPNGYKYLLENFAESDIDILSYWTTTIDDYILKHDYREKGDVSGKILFDDSGIEAIIRMDIGAFLVNKLFRRAFIEEAGIRLESLSIGEDALFCLRSLINAKRVVSCNSNFYRYVVNEGSITKSRDAMFMRRCVDSIFILLQRIVQYSREHESNIRLRAKLSDSINKQSMVMISRILSADYTIGEFKEIAHKMRQFGILPLTSNDGETRIVRLGRLVITALYACPFCFPIASLIYKKIFIQHILPKLSRN